MSVRAAAAFAIFALGLAGAVEPAAAQIFLPGSRPVPVRPLLPPVDVETEVSPYDSPPGYRQPGTPERYALPPPGYEPPPAPMRPQYGRRAPIYPDDAEPAPVPPGSIYREPPPGYEPIDPRARIGRPNYGTPPNYDSAPPTYGAPPTYTPPPQNYGAAPVAPQEALRPPLSIGPQEDAVGGLPPAGALPPEDQPETGPRKELPPQFRRTMVDYRTREPVGTLIIDTPNTYLYLVLGNGKAMRYGIGVGRDGFTWAGAEKVSRMAEWPDWHPPTEMIERQPYLPRFMAGGPGNPLGARALYLGKTLYRIHGTNQPSTIGTFVSSGCIRLTNEDVSDLYTRVQVGTRVVVLPGGAPPSAAAPVGPQAEGTPPGPYNPLAPPRAR
jgi:lipoprotein-anchoring transpeptidase ErfK/SrfK